ncbi:MAG: AEC family transporter [Natronospirillum sp.]|uniref:AEC family transporter n=1 Tax=Natronospirillum sp. TaxID=2812955 RepID=UPI0025D16940|nr:AEC family transporter [Natronospirillum sp.]MCH8553475.1 AEC family transporter [Natronospirillum sp.]
MDILFNETSVQLFQRIFSVVFPLAAIAALGFLYARKRPTDMAVANRINIDVFIPALIFSVMASSDFRLLDYLPLALGAVVVALGSALIAWPFCRWLGVVPRTLLPPMMFNNSGNLGIPLLVLAFGEAALPAAIVMFVVSNLLHFTVGIYILEGHSRPLQTLRMPIILASIIGVIFSIWNVTIPEPLFIAIEMLGQVSIPLMLFALGVRMTDVDLGQWKLGLWGTILSPLSGLIPVLFFQLVFRLDADQFAYLLVFAALPPAVLNYMLAEKYNQDPDKVAAMVLMGNIGSLAIIPVVLAFIL